MDFQRNRLSNNSIHYDIHWDIKRLFAHFHEFWKVSKICVYISIFNNLILVLCLRYNALKMPNQIRQNQSKMAKPMILIAISLSLFWSLMPLIGWSRYSLESALTSCSPEWRDHSLNVISFNISIIFCVLGVPFTILIVSNIMLIRIVCLVLFIFYCHES